MTDLELTQAGQIKYLRELLESERQARIAAELRCESVRKDCDTLARCVDELRGKVKDSILPIVDIITTKADIDLCLGSGELLKCPFCGHWAMSAGEKTPNGTAVCWKISCTRSTHLVPSCCASVWHTDRDPEKARREAVAKWNRRTMQQPAPAVAGDKGEG